MPTQQEISEALAVLTSAFTLSQATTAVEDAFLALGQIEQPASLTFSSQDGAAVSTYFNAAPDLAAGPESRGIDVLGQAVASAAAAMDSVSPPNPSGLVWALIAFFRGWATRQPALRSSIWGG